MQRDGVENRRRNKERMRENDQETGSVRVWSACVWSACVCVCVACVWSVIREKKTLTRQKVMVEWFHTVKTARVCV